MRTFMKAISRIIKGPSVEDRKSSVRFLERCENFRLLLSANNSALKRMAELTEAAQGIDPVSMTYIRAENVRISADVRNMIERLCRIAPGRYEGLKEVFNKILVRMNNELTADETEHCGPFVLQISDLDSSQIHEAGSKMAMLGEIAKLPGVRVPDGFSITASAFMSLLSETGLDKELKRVAQICGEDSYASLCLLEKNVWETLSLCQIPPRLEQDVITAAKQLAAGRKISLAVRSSALCEDSPGMSFAGQFHTELGVAPADVLEAYRSIIASMYTVTAITYRTNHGVRDDDLIMCVGCVEMIDAVAGGVAYSHDPSGLHPGQILVSAVRGLPCSIVDGAACGDLWRLDRDNLTLLYTEKSDQEFGKFVSLDGRIVKRRLDAKIKDAPSIDDSVLSRIGKTILNLENHLGCPQDVEWALTEDGTLYVLQCRPLSIVSGNNSQNVSAKLESLPLLAEECPCASPGIASGEIYFVETDHDMPCFPIGGVLLARVASPELAALLPQASAVVTEFGSCTGHLANVAREYGIPALIGVTDAVCILKEKKTVTIDAWQGRIFSGGSECSATSPRINLSHTPVGRILSSILKQIIPLNLTDPGSPEFIPENCVTLHDITRFCHEKSVAEMFKEHAEIDASARQIEDGNRLQYWIIDLGDGLCDSAGSAENKCVQLKDIRSNAMKSLWTGMTKFPWEGPPDISVSGFASVLFGATCNPELVSGRRSSMGDRNYFMVGRNYCSLQSRMGFHYCTIEGFAGSDNEMNYVLFQFKGGGAGMDRRSLRLKLVAGILEEHGFYTSIRDDVLFARMEGIASQVAEQGLTIAGYLLVQTRQLDMIMKDSSLVERYRSRFHEEIESLISGGEN